MSKQIEALKLALECVEAWDRGCDRDLYWRDIEAAITAIREALAEQPAQQKEPVATMWQHGETGRTRITMPGDITDCGARWFKVSDLYTSPQPSEPLTDEEIMEMYNEPRSDAEMITFARAIEAAHGITGEQK